MRAMVLAAGLGMRMRPLSEHTPKPLIEVGGKKLIDWSLDALADAGITEIVVNCSYLAEQIEAYAKSRDDLSITLSHEETPLETGGGIKRALPHLGAEPFIVMNSDAFCLQGAKAIAQLQRVAAQTAHPITLLLQPRADAVGYHGAGDFSLTAEGKIRRRMAEENAAPYVFTGIQILDPALFASVQEECFSMNVLYDQSKDESGVLQHVAACVHEGVWLHVGSPQEKQIAEDYLQEKGAA